MKATKLVSLLLCAAMLLSVVGCAKDPSGTGDTAQKQETEGPAPTQAQTVSAENSAVTIDAVTLDVGEFAIDGEQSVTIEPLEEQSDESGDWKLTAYEINIGDYTQLDDFIEIRLPYDASLIEPGQDEAACVTPVWFNEEAEQWETVYGTVDTEAKEVIIQTDHLSQYGITVIRDPGKREAMIEKLGGAPIMNLGAMAGTMDPGEAVELLNSFVENGGRYGSDVTVSAGWNVVKDALGINDAASLAHAAITNPMAVVGLGDPAFDTELGYWLNDKVGKVGVALSVVTIAGGLLKGQDDTILNSYKEATNLILGKSLDKLNLGGGVLGIAMAGVWIFDYTISSLFDEAKNLKAEKIDKVVQGWAFEHRTTKEWRETLIKLCKEHINEPEAVMEALRIEVQSFVEEFWDLDIDERYVYFDRYGDYWIVPNYTEDEEDAATERAIAQIYPILTPVLTSVENYFSQQMVQEYFRAVNDTIRSYNLWIPIRIAEVRESESDDLKYAGCTVRFAPLSEDADVADWTLTLDEEGGCTTNCTPLGFLIAGCPEKVQVFNPEDDPDTAEPIAEAPMVLKQRGSRIELKSGFAPEDLYGTYTGTMTLSHAAVTEEGYNLWLSEAEYDEAPSRAECDDAVNSSLSEGSCSSIYSFEIMPIEGSSEVAVRAIFDFDEDPFHVFTYGRPIHDTLTLDITYHAALSKDPDGTIHLSGTEIPFHLYADGELKPITDLNTAYNSVPFIDYYMTFDVSKAPQEGS